MVAKTALLCVVVMLSVGRAAADDRQTEAREHYKRGNTLYDLRRFKEAAHEYEQAFEIVDDPALLFNIAQAYRLSGDFESSIMTFRAFLRRQPDSKLRGEVMARIRDMQELQAKQKQSAESPPVGTLPPAQKPEPKPESPKSPPPESEPKPIAPAPPAAVVAPAQPSPATRHRQRVEKIAGLTLGIAGVLALGGGVAGAVLAGQASDQITHPRMGALWDSSVAGRGQAAESAAIALFTVGGVALAACAALEGAARR